MIVIFDLDDTLYDERSFVESGLRAVSQLGLESFGLDVDASFSFMMRVSEADGRGRIFDDWLAEHGLRTKRRVAECIKSYRYHLPDIIMPKPHRDLLERLRRSHPLYLVTDGHKIAQHRKVEALGIAPCFRRVFITHRFGIAQAKPSLYCFERIKQSEGCDWSQMLYVGDNPAKDFVNLNKVGAVTIRVHTGVHADVAAKPGFDATHHIERLTDFEPLLARPTGQTM